MRVVQVNPWSKCSRVFGWKFPRMCEGRLVWVAVELELENKSVGSSSVRVIHYGMPQVYEDQDRHHSCLPPDYRNVVLHKKHARMRGVARVDSTVSSLC